MGVETMLYLTSMLFGFGTVTELTIVDEWRFDHFFILPFFYKKWSLLVEYSVYRP